jgi:PKD repeat protein
LTATVTAGHLVSYTWLFGDGTGGQGNVVTHTYSAPGTYPVTVTANNPVSVLTTTTTVTVVEAISGLLASNDSPTALGDPTTLTATVSAGSNAEFSWAFGDGATGTGATLAHTYPATGTYTAVVTATNSVSNVTATTTVTVVETISGLLASNDSPTVLGDSTTLTATVAAGSNAEFSWAFGDGATGTGATLAHTYLATGTYPAVVTATNSVSSVTATTIVTVVEPEYLIYLPALFKPFSATTVLPD